MAHIRWTLFAGVMWMAFSLGMAGCGKTNPPPKGAPPDSEKQVDPDIQLGNPSGAPTETKEAPTGSSKVHEVPKDEKGDN